MKNGEFFIDRKSSTGPILMDLPKAFDKKKTQYTNSYVYGWDKSSLKLLFS